ncbi:hypothetical protein C4K34_4370 [Pseudomonas chlororaphis subsp. piscium]|nr:hypothetical protein C4K34_4370 [Pseudomonas chlororaphis subsp. piscium]AZC83427.1 hypothetical protein C4K30_4327 [Pseudomonas chlororaphis subsp. piscium]
MAGSPVRADEVLLGQQSWVFGGQQRSSNLPRSLGGVSPLVGTNP